MAAQLQPITSAGLSALRETVPFATKKLSINARYVVLQSDHLVNCQTGIRETEGIHFVDEIEAVY